MPVAVVVPADRGRRRAPRRVGRRVLPLLSVLLPLQLLPDLLLLLLPKRVLRGKSLMKNLFMSKYCVKCKRLLLRRL